MKKYQLFSASALVLFSSLSDGYGNPGKCAALEGAKRVVPMVMRRVVATLGQEAVAAVPRAVPAAFRKEVVSSAESISSRFAMTSSAATPPRSSKMHVMIEAESKASWGPSQAYRQPYSNVVQDPSALISKESQNFSSQGMERRASQPVTIEKLLASSMMRASSASMKLQKSALLGAAREELQDTSRGFIKVVSGNLVGIRTPYVGRSSYSGFHEQKIARRYSTQAVQENDKDTIKRVFVDNFGIGPNDSLAIAAKKFIENKDILDTLIGGEPRIVLDPASHTFEQILSCVEENCYKTFKDPDVVSMLGEELSEKLSKTAENILISGKTISRNSYSFGGDRGRREGYYSISDAWDQSRGELHRKMHDMIMASSTKDLREMGTVAKLQLTIHNVETLDKVCTDSLAM